MLFSSVPVLTTVSGCIGGLGVTLPCCSPSLERVLVVSGGTEGFVVVCVVLLPSGVVVVSGGTGGLGVVCVVVVVVVSGGTVGFVVVVVVVVSGGTVGFVVVCVVVSGTGG